jgi:hypothetical protein
VVLIGQEPLLEAWRQTNQALLTLYGNPGETYRISHSTNLNDNIWQPGWTAPMTNLFQTYPLDTPLPQRFYRAQTEQ